VGESWQSDDDFIRFYDLTLSPTGSTSTVDVRFTVENELTFAAGKTHELERQVTGGVWGGDASTGDIDINVEPTFRYDIDGMSFTGTDPYRVNLYPATPGTPWYGTVSEDSVVDHVTVANSYLDGAEIDALDESNIDGGDNGRSWVFDDYQQVVVIS
jgi:hypothetical protein